MLKPNRPPVEIDLPNDLQTIQGIVGGYADEFPYLDNMIFLFNEEGKDLGLQPNLYLNHGELYFDVIVGNVLVVGTHIPEMVSLTEEQIRFCLEDLSDHRVII